MTLPREVFLSHATPDNAFATLVAETLRGHGVPVWYSRTNILGAQQWHDEIGAALERCDWFVLVLSAHSVGSLWVKRELLYALQQSRFENRIVPLLYQPCDPARLSWVLPGSQTVDFQSDQTQGFRELLRVWGLGYAP